MKKIFSSVKAKLIFVIVSVAAIPIILTLVINYFQSSSTAQKNVSALNAAQEKLVQHDFNEIVERNKTVLETIAESDSVRNALLGSSNEEALKIWLKQADDDLGDGNSCIIVNADGMQIIRNSGNLVNVSDREYFKKARDTGKFYVSDQNISKTTSERICTFIVPVYDLNNNFIGAVQRNFNLDKFTELVKAEVTEENQDILIADNNGDVVAHSRIDLNTGETENQSDTPWYQNSRSSMDASGEYNANFEGVNYFVSYQRDPVTGWVTMVARDESVSMASANRTIIIGIIVGVIMIIIAVVVAVILANSFTTPVKELNNTIAKVSEGKFAKITNKKIINRTDEFGEITHNMNALVSKLKSVVGNIQKASSIVDNHASELADTAKQISGTADGVSEAVHEMAEGASNQADSVLRSTESIGLLSDAVQNVSDNAENLADNAAIMNDASQSSADALKKLQTNMDKMGEAVRIIGSTMEETNGAVNKVNEKVDGITGIASQTNLLALNASIEAARAGEMGKGFAVVAEEIGKLASESAQTAGEIRDEMSMLLAHANDATEKTAEVSAIGDEVITVLSETVDIIQGLIDNVSGTVDGVNTISDLTDECNSNKEQIVDAMHSLSEISERNAASTQETSSSMQELNTTVNVLAKSAESLKDVASQLEEELTFFEG